MDKELDEFILETRNLLDTLRDLNSFQFEAVQSGSYTEIRVKSSQSLYKVDEKVCKEWVKELNQAIKPLIAKRVLEIKNRIASLKPKQQTKGKKQ